MSVDARIYRIKKTVGGIKNIIGVVSGKGGVGKTTISAVMSLILSVKGYSVGLLDLDFHGPSCHTILGIEDLEYEEEKGINPYRITKNLYFASIYPFVKDEYVPLRGKALSNALIEFLSILNWRKIDYLIVDMPPGMGDILLDIVRLIPNSKFIAVTTNSVLSIQTVGRLIKFIIDSRLELQGIIANMIRNYDTRARRLAEELSVNFLGSVPFDADYENTIGNPQSILGTKLASALKEIVERHIT